MERTKEVASETMLNCSLKVGFSAHATMHLFRHFREFLANEIRSRGFTVSDPELFDQVWFDAKAYELAHDVQGRVNLIVTDTDISNLDLLGDMAGFIAETIAEETTAVMDEFLNDGLGGVDVLIQLAAGEFPHIPIKPLPKTE